MRLWKINYVLIILNFHWETKILSFMINSKIIKISRTFKISINSTKYVENDNSLVNSITVIRPKFKFFILEYNNYTKKT